MKEKLKIPQKDINKIITELQDYIDPKVGKQAIMEKYKINPFTLQQELKKFLTEQTSEELTTFSVDNNTYADKELVIESDPYEVGGFKIIINDTGDKWLVFKTREDAEIAARKKIEQAIRNLGPEKVLGRDKCIEYFFANKGIDDYLEGIINYLGIGKILSSESGKEFQVSGTGRLDDVVLAYKLEKKTMKSSDKAQIENDEISNEPQLEQEQ